MNALNTSLSDLTHEDVDRILSIVNGMDDVELHLQMGEVSLHVRKGNVGAAAHGLFEGASADRAVQAAAGSSVPASQVAAPVAVPASAQLPAAEASPGEGAQAATVSAPAKGADEGLVDIVAPMIGRFYRAPAPNEPAFVDVGSVIKAEDTVCIIEVMKLFNTVSAGVTGEIVEIVAQDGQMMEEGGVLFRVRPQ